MRESVCVLLLLLLLLLLFVLFRFLMRIFDPLIAHIFSVVMGRGASGGVWGGGGSGKRGTVFI